MIEAVYAVKNTGYYGGRIIIRYSYQHDAEDGCSKVKNSPSVQLGHVAVRERM